MFCYSAQPPHKVQWVRSSVNFSPSLQKWDVTLKHLPGVAGLPFGALSGKRWTNLRGYIEGICHLSAKIQSSFTSLARFLLRDMFWRIKSIETRERNLNISKTFHIEHLIKSLTEDGWTMEEMEESLKNNTHIGMEKWRMWWGNHKDEYILNWKGEVGYQRKTW